jgi:hypothetical protein
MTRPKFTRSTLVGGSAVALALASALVFAGNEGAASYTGCLNVNGGTIVSVAPGDTPLAPCGPNQIQVRLGAGDITSIKAGTGLQGGTTNGDATLSVQPSYRLPQTCSFGAVAKWTGTAWECGTDADTDTSAIAGFSEVGPFTTEGIPSDPAPIKKLIVPAGKYAIFAKIHLRFVEPHSELDYVFCQLRAESDVDWEILGTLDGGEKTEGTMSLMLVHEFTGEGFVELWCEDRGEYELLDYSDAEWSNLRITAIKLGSFENVPLTW